MEPQTETTPVIDFNLQRILTLYADGLTVGEIAASFSKSEGWIYEQMRKVPENYEAAKQQREQVKGAKFNRAEMLATQIVIEQLEAQKITDPKDLCSIAKTFGDKARLIEGKATGRIDIGDVPTDEEWARFWEKQKNAGTALDTKSIQT